MSQIPYWDYDVPLQTPPELTSTCLRNLSSHFTQLIVILYYAIYEGAHK